MVRVFLTSALKGGDWSASRFGRLTIKEVGTDTLWIPNWWAPESVWTWWSAV